MIGINVSGAEYTWETYPGAQDLAYLKSQNIELIRLPVCWEKLQPTLGGSLDAAEVAALKAFLAEADAAGMKVIVDLHNYGRYDSDWQAKADANYGYFAPGTGDPIGSAEVPVAKFADFWAKLATELKDAPGVSGYDIMNEPFNMGGTGVWPAAAQAAVDAIRAIDMDTLILVEGTQWASAMYWPWDNANLVIDDPADNLVYQAHIYFDSNGSGMYDTSYDASGAYPNIGVDRIQPFIDWLAAHNAKGMIGEFGVPDDDPRWIPVLEAFCAALNEAGMSGTYWNYTYRTDSGVPWWPVDDNKSIKPLVDGSGLAQLEVLTEYADGFDDPMFADDDPDAPVIASLISDSGIVGDGITSDNTPTLAGTGEPGGTVKLYAGATLVGSATVDAQGKWSLAAGTLADGVHVLTATVTDADGNTSDASIEFPVTIDTTAPAKPTIGGFGSDSGTVGDRITSDTTLTFTGSGESNGTVRIYDGATLLGTANVGANGTWTFTTGALANGAHSVTARVVDAAGNVGASSTALVVTVDTVAPGRPAITGFAADSGVADDGVTGDATPTLAGTGEANGRVQIYDGATLLGTAAIDAHGAWTFTAGILTDGRHSFTAQVIDAAGNRGVASTPLIVTIDTTAPSAPVIANQNETIAEDTIALSGTAEGHGTVAIYDGATLLGTAAVDAGGTWSFVAAALADGSHMLTARVTDAAGNTSAASTAILVTVDPTVPPRPAITGFAGDTGVVGDGITGDNTPVLTGTARADAVVEVYAGSVLVGTTTADADGAWSFAAAAIQDGTHAFTARVNDGDGGVSGASVPLHVTIDTAAPLAPRLTGISRDTGKPGDRITSDATITITGTGEAGSVVRVYDGATAIGATAVGADGTWSLTTATLADGKHSFAARATDAAHNTGASSAALAVTVDTRAPAAPSFTGYSTDSGEVGDRVTNDRTLTLSGVGEARGTVEVYDGAKLVGTATVGNNGTWNVKTANLSDGTHSFTAKVTDLAGNTGGTSAKLVVTIDSSAPIKPTIAIVDPGAAADGDGTVSGNHLTLAGSAEAHANIEIYDGTVRVGTALVGADGNWTFYADFVTRGVHTFTARVVDDAGNTSGASRSVVVTIGQGAICDLPVMKEPSLGDTGADAFVDAYATIDFGEPNSPAPPTVDIRATGDVQPPDGFPPGAAPQAGPAYPGPVWGSMAFRDDADGPADQAGWADTVTQEDDVAGAEFPFSAAGDPFGAAGEAYPPAIAAAIYVPDDLFVL